MKPSKSSKSASTARPVRKLRHGNFFDKHNCYSAEIMDYNFMGIPAMVLKCNKCGKINVLKAPVGYITYSLN